MHNLKDCSSVNVPSNNSSTRKSLKEANLSNISIKSEGDSNKAIETSVISSTNLRRSSRVPKFINLESKDYESIAKASNMKCNNSETDISIQSSIVASIKKNNKLCHKIAKKSSKTNKKVKLDVEKPNKPFIFKTTSSKGKSLKSKPELALLEASNHLQLNSEVQMTGKKRLFNGSSSTNRDMEPSFESLGSGMDSNSEDKPKKKKVPVLPENEAVINSYVKYQTYFTETTLKSGLINYAKTADSLESSDKASSCGKEQTSKHDKLHCENSNSSNKVFSPIPPNKINSGSSDNACESNKVTTLLDFSSLKDTKYIKAVELNLSVSEAMTGNRTISTMASLDMDIINSITHFRSHSNSSNKMNRSLSKGKKDARPTIFSIVKTNNKKVDSTERTKSNKAYGKDNKSKIHTSINIISKI